jgi:hypothetical protein
MQLYKFQFEYLLHQFWHFICVITKAWLCMWVVRRHGGLQSVDELEGESQETFA